MGNEHGKAMVTLLSALMSAQNHIKSVLTGLTALALSCHYNEKTQLTDTHTYTDNENKGEIPAVGVRDITGWESALLRN